MRSITSLSKADLEGKRVILRLDLNVPMEDGQVTDDYRIVSAIPTVNYLLDNVAKVIVIAHCEANVLGEQCSLDPAIAVLKKHISSTELEVLPNLRENKGEKENDPEFAKHLASLGDIYVNDAFSVSHREHASIVGVPKLLPSYAGLQLEREVTELSKAFNPEHPFLFILGGAKFSTKLPLIEKFLNKADSIFIGGALANDLLKAEGRDVKRSLVSKEEVDLSKIIESPKLIKVEDMVWDGEVIRDVGEKTVEKLGEKIKKAKFVLWNGPLGNTEAGYAEATKKVAEMIASSGAYSIVGGGDTLAAIKSLGLEDKFSFISTGGGSTLDFLANGTLPGIKALA